MIEWLTNAWTWIEAHWTDVLAIWIGIIGVSEVIVKWTDTKKDDAILGTIRAIGVKIISGLTKFGLEAPKDK